jgi:hypothetical protein
MVCNVPQPFIEVMFLAMFLFHFCKVASGAAFKVHMVLV